MTQPTSPTDRELAENCAEDCGLTLGTDRAWGVVTGFEAGLAHGRQQAAEGVAGLMSQLEVIANRKIDKHVAHPQSVWFSTWVMEPLQQVLAKHKARL